MKSPWVYFYPQQLRRQLLDCPGFFKLFHRSIQTSLTVLNIIDIQPEHLKTESFQENKNGNVHVEKILFEAHSFFAD